MNKRVLQVNHSNQTFLPIVQLPYMVFGIYVKTEACGSDLVKTC